MNEKSQPSVSNGMEIRNIAIMAHVDHPSSKAKLTTGRDVVTRTYLF